MPSTPRPDDQPAAFADDHPDDLALCRYLDGALSRPARRAVEEHLADCADCRLLVAETAAVLEDPEILEATGDGRRSARWLPRPALGGRLAAGLSAAGLVVAGLVVALVVASAALVFGPTWDFGPPGDEPDLPGRERFEGFVGDRRAAERSPRDAVLVATAPRWEAVSAARPTLRWTAPPWLAVETVDAVELILVDEAERLVASVTLDAWPLDTASGDGRQAAVDYPDDAPSLVPGGVYAWRVSVRADGEWLGSEFVPFRRLGEEAEE